MQMFVTIENEKNPNRLEMFFYSIRNDAYNCIKYCNASRLGMLRREVSNALHYAMQGNRKAAKISLKAAIVIMTFYPKIDYPSK